jgi:hypothetical protein
MEIAPCTHCNEEKVAPIQLAGQWVVECSACLARGPRESTEERSIAAWNYRHFPSNDPDTIARYLATQFDARSALVILLGANINNVVAIATHDQDLNPLAEVVARIAQQLRGGKIVVSTMN